MPSKNPSQRLRDILQNIEAAQAFAAGMTFEQFVADRKTVYAVTRAFEIISEASRRIRYEFREQFPHIDWTAIAAAGNIYRHHYDAVDDALLWYTLQHDLAPLRDAVAAELARAEAGSA